MTIPSYDEQNRRSVSTSPDPGMSWGALIRDVMLGQLEFLAITETGATAAEAEVRAAEIMRRYEHQLVTPEVNRRMLLEAAGLVGPI